MKNVEVSFRLKEGATTEVTYVVSVDVRQKVNRLLYISLRSIPAFITTPINYNLRDLIK
jgi:hypothetical protein